jgi:transposase
VTPHEESDRMLQHLAGLPPLSPDPARAARVRARCHRHLARGRRSRKTATMPRFGRRHVAAVVVLGLCALYLASFVGTALRLG